MKVYCDRCNFTKDYEEVPPPNECPQCDPPKGELRFEKDKNWHSYCRFTWAYGCGFLRARSSLPRWICRKNRLRNCEAFKTGLINTEVIGPPPCQPDKVDQVIEYWLKATGVYQNVKDVLRLNPLLGIGMRTE